MRELLRLFSQKQSTTPNQPIWDPGLSVKLAYGVDASQYVSDLRKAKAYSDKKRYEEKKRILQRLILQDPNSWVVDSPDENYPGVTHEPTSFQFHTNRQLADLINSLQVSKQSAAPGVFYHGTYPDRIDQILREGLDPNYHGQGGGTLPGLNEVDSRSKIWLTKSPNYARFYARMAAKTYAQRKAKEEGKSWLRRLFANADAADLLKVTLPADFPITTISDGFGDEHYVTQRIPPEYIKLLSESNGNKTNSEVSKQAAAPSQPIWDPGLNVKTAGARWRTDAALRLLLGRSNYNSTNITRSEAISVVNRALGMPEYGQGTSKLIKELDSQRDLLPRLVRQERRMHKGVEPVTLYRGTKFLDPLVSKTRNYRGDSVALASPLWHVAAGHGDYAPKTSIGKFVTRLKNNRGQQLYAPDYTHSGYESWSKKLVDEVKNKAQNNRFVNEWDMKNTPIYGSRTVRDVGRSDSLARVFYETPISDKNKLLDRLLFRWRGDVPVVNRIPNNRRWQNIFESLSRPVFPKQSTAPLVDNDLGHILVTGHSGSGKSTYAKKLSKDTGKPVIHIDEVFPEWREFMRRDGDRHLQVDSPTRDEYLALRRDIVLRALATETPSIIEGTQLLGSSDLWGGHDVRLIDPSESTIVRRRLRRDRTKPDRAKLMEPGSSFARARADVAKKIIANYRDEVEAARNYPGTKVIKQSAAPESTKTASSDSVSSIIDKVKFHAPRIRLPDSIAGALAGGGIGALLPVDSDEDDDSSSSRQRLKQILLGAVLGAGASNVIGDRARRYIVNNLVPAGYSGLGDTGDSHFKQLIPKSFRDFLNTAVLDNPSEKMDNLITMESDDTGKLFTLPPVHTQARQELFRRSAGLPIKDKANAFFKSKGFHDYVPTETSGGIAGNYEFVGINPSRWNKELQGSLEQTRPFRKLMDRVRGVGNDPSLEDHYAALGDWLSRHGYRRPREGVLNIHDHWDFGLTPRENQLLKQQVLQPWKWNRLSDTYSKDIQGGWRAAIDPVFIDDERIPTNKQHMIALLKRKLLDDLFLKNHGVVFDQDFDIATGKPMFAKQSAAPFLHGSTLKKHLLGLVFPRSQTLARGMPRGYQGKPPTTFNPYASENKILKQSLADNPYLSPTYHRKMKVPNLKGVRTLYGDPISVSKFTAAELYPKSVSHPYRVGVRDLFNAVRGGDMGLPLKNTYVDLPKKFFRPLHSVHTDLAETAAYNVVRRELLKRRTKFLARLSAASGIGAGVVKELGSVIKEEVDAFNRSKYLDDKLKSLQEKQSASPSQPIWDPGLGDKTAAMRKLATGARAMRIAKVKDITRRMFGDAARNHMPYDSVKELARREARTRSAQGLLKSPPENLYYVFDKQTPATLTEEGRLLYKKSFEDALLSPERRTPKLFPGNTSRLNKLRRDQIELRAGRALVDAETQQAVAEDALAELAMLKKFISMPRSIRDRDAVMLLSPFADRSLASTQALNSARLGSRSLWDIVTGGSKATRLAKQRLQQLSYGDEVATTRAWSQDLAKAKRRIHEINRRFIDKVSLGNQSGRGKLDIDMISNKLQNVLSNVSSPRIKATSIDGMRRISPGSPIWYSGRTDVPVGYLSNYRSPVLAATSENTLRQFGPLSPLHPHVHTDTRNMFLDRIKQLAPGGRNRGWSTQPDYEQVATMPKFTEWMKSHRFFRPKPGQIDQLQELSPRAFGIRFAKQSAAPTSELKAAGLAIVAEDTKRVLLLQRALTEGDTAAGKWEFPGGHIEPGESPLETAKREWEEEIGRKLPTSLIIHTDYKEGVYVAFVGVVPKESDVRMNGHGPGRRVMNPDDPDRDNIEVAAWWTQKDLKNSNLLRKELKSVIKTKALPTIRLALLKSRVRKKASMGTDLITKLSSAHKQMSQELLFNEFQALCTEKYAELKSHIGSSNVKLADGEFEKLKERLSGLVDSAKGKLTDIAVSNRVKGVSNSMQQNREKITAFIKASLNDPELRPYATAALGAAAGGAGMVGAELVSNRKHKRYLNSLLTGALGGGVLGGSYGYLTQPTDVIEQPDSRMTTEAWEKLQENPELFEFIDEAIKEKTPGTWETHGRPSLNLAVDFASDAPAWDAAVGGTIGYKAGKHLVEPTWQKGLDNQWWKNVRDPSSAKFKRTINFLRNYQYQPEGVEAGKRQIAVPASSKAISRGVPTGVGALLGWGLLKPTLRMVTGRNASPESNIVETLSSGVPKHPWDTPT